MKYKFCPSCDRETYKVKQIRVDGKNKWDRHCTACGYRPGMDKGESMTALNRRLNKEVPADVDFMRGGKV